MTYKVIYVKPATKAKLTAVCPKSKTYGDFIEELVELKEKVKTK